MTTSDDQPPGELPDYGSAPKPPAGPLPLDPVPPPAPTVPTGTPGPSINQKALWSMILGIVAVFGLCCIIGGFIGIPAIVLGFLARAEITRSGGTQTGLGMATAGIAIGAVSELGSIVWLLLFSVGAL